MAVELSTALVECSRESWHELRENKKVFIPLGQKTSRSRQGNSERISGETLTLGSTIWGVRNWADYLSYVDNDPEDRANFQFAWRNMKPGTVGTAVSCTQNHKTSTIPSKT